jgi:hypothetical protein
VKASYLFQLAKKLHDLAKGGEKMRQVYEDVQNGHKDTRALNDAEFYFSGDYTVLQLPGTMDSQAMVQGSQESFEKLTGKTFNSRDVDMVMARSLLMVVAELKFWQKEIPK